MPDQQIIERTTDTTRIRSGDNGQHVTIRNVLPILPIRNLVVFPGTVMPLNVGRPKSKALLEEVMPGDKIIGVVAQRDADHEDPGQDDLNAVGVACSILKLFRLPDGNQSIIVHGLARFRVVGVEQADPFMSARIEILEDVVKPGPELDALVANARQQANRVIELSPNTPDEAAQVLANITEPGALADFLAANLQTEVGPKQELLEEPDVAERLRVIANRLGQQVDVLELQSKIQSQVKENIDKTQRQFYLREQLKAIRKELGEGGGEGGESDAELLRKRLEDADPPENVMKEANRELDRLDAIPQASPEYGIIRTYLEMLADLPWNKESETHIDLAEARRVLDADHHDLDKVKRRIIEYLAVKKLKPDGGGAILCFLGPPGVGKTSLGQSIAKATGRHFIRVALGGVRDESEIRGHRRTYIGSMPGRIISELRKGGTKNPVMMLDEIDKLGNDFRGDPAAALLEVLDPAQNHTFTDHYLDVPFDLSRVLFIATANSMDTVPGPLRDRMEVIDIPGYTQSDKLSIAKQYLVPRQLDANGLKTDQATFTDAALRLVIESYTREAGVRNLERQIGSVARSIAADVVSKGGAPEPAPTSDGKAGTNGSAKKVRAKKPKKIKAVTVDPRKVEAVLGAIKFEPELASRTAVPGVATGMAYTPFGGEILFIEAGRMPGKGNIILTGQIGDVMRESATAAFSLVRSRAESMGIDPKLLAESDVHLHIPAGAVPKDGPSAGVAMFLALASLLLNKPVRHDVAMTGEITLRGLVLPIGGLKEKTLAAKRAGITEIIAPKRNEKDFSELPEEVRQSLKWHWVSTVDEAMAVALPGASVKESKLKDKPAKKTAAKKSAAKKTTRARATPA